MAVRRNDTFRLKQDVRRTYISFVRVTGFNIRWRRIVSLDEKASKEKIKSLKVKIYLYIMCY